MEVYVNEKGREVRAPGSGPAPAGSAEARKPIAKHVVARAADRAARGDLPLDPPQKCPPVRHPEPPLSSVSSLPPGSHELPVSSPPTVQGLGQDGSPRPPPKS
jgi:hypothetical protein